MQPKRSWQTRLPSLGQDDLAADGDVTIPKSHFTYHPSLILQNSTLTSMRIRTPESLHSNGCYHVRATSNGQSSTWELQWWQAGRAVV